MASISLIWRASRGFACGPITRAGPDALAIGLRNARLSGHFLGQLAAARFLDRGLKLGSQIDAHFLGALLGPQPNVAGVTVEGVVARLGGIKTLKPRGFALDHREARHHPPQPGRVTGGA